MRKQLGYDQDGDGIMFSSEDREAIQEEITFIDTELAGSCTETVRNELMRQRRQLAAELAAGHFLPMLEEA